MKGCVLRGRFFVRMGRRRAVVEGITLDLTDISGDAVISLPVEVLKEKAAFKAPKARKEPPDPLSVDTVTEILKSMENTCSDCNVVKFYPLWSWQNLTLCNKCHRTRFVLIEEEIKQYMIEKGHTHCAFCNKDRLDRHEFHFDHINMFTKIGSVGKMMYSGTSVELIKAEIDKCQLLCTSCHAAVTHFERKFGFIREKRQLKKNPKPDIMERYNTYMGAVYAALRLRGGGGGLNLGNL